LEAPKQQLDTDAAVLCIGTADSAKSIENMYSVTEFDPRYPALLIDFGGVLTESVMGAFTEACASLGVNGGPFIAEVFSSQHADDSPFALFELGHIDTSEFIERNPNRPQEAFGRRGRGP
jgi:hypothetical protein